MKELDHTVYDFNTGERRVITPDHRSLRDALRKAIADVIDLAEEGQSDYGPDIDYEERHKVADDRLELLIEQVPDSDIHEPIDVEP